MKAELRQLEEDGRLSGARATGDHVQVRVLETHHLSSIVDHASRGLILSACPPLVVKNRPMFECDGSERTEKCHHFLFVRTWLFSEAGPLT